jgi:hypothetical protein
MSAANDAHSSGGADDDSKKDAGLIPAHFLFDVPVKKINDAVNGQRVDMKSCHSRMRSHERAVR